MENAIDLYSNLQNPMDAIDRIGAFFAKSGMFGCDNPEQGKVLAMVCLSERKSPVEISRTYDIVDGKLRKKAMAAHAEFRKAGGKVRWIKTGDENLPPDQLEAVAEVTFEGQTILVKFTMAQAKQQGLVREKSNWIKTPGNMLRARLMSNAIGILCPEIYAGDVGDEETDFPLRAPMDLARETGKETPIEPKPANVVDVKTTAGPSTTVSSEAKAEVPAVQVQAQTSAPPKATIAQTELSPALVDELEKVIGTHGPQVGKWLVENQWLMPGQGLAQLSEVRARKIVKQWPSFERALGITPVPAAA